MVEYFETGIDRSLVKKMHVQPVDQLP